MRVSARSEAQSPLLQWVFGVSGLRRLPDVLGRDSDLIIPLDATKEVTNHLHFRHSPSLKRTFWPLHYEPLIPLIMPLPMSCLYGCIGNKRPVAKHARWKNAAPTPCTANPHPEPQNPNLTIRKTRKQLHYRAHIGCMDRRLASGRGPFWAKPSCSLSPTPRALNSTRTKSRENQGRNA